MSNDTIYTITSTYYTPGCGLYPVGVVLVYDETTQQPCAYIGGFDMVDIPATTANEFNTIKATEDILQDWGARLPRHVAEAIFNMELPNYKDQAPPTYKFSDEGGVGVPRD